MNTQLQLDFRETSFGTFYYDVTAAVLGLNGPFTMIEGNFRVMPNGAAILTFGDYRLAAFNPETRKLTLDVQGMYGDDWNRYDSISAAYLKQALADAIALHWRDEVLNPKTLEVLER